MLVAFGSSSPEDRTPAQASTPVSCRRAGQDTVTDRQFWDDPTYEAQVPAGTITLVSPNSITGVSWLPFHR